MATQIDIPEQFVTEGVTKTPKRVAPLDHAYLWIEKQAGWLVLFSTIPVAIVISIAMGAGSPQAWWFVAAMPPFLLCTIVLFTRPLVEPSDINAAFRFGWAFLLSLLFASGILLYTTLRPPLTSEEVLNQQLQKELMEKKAQEKRQELGLATKPSGVSAPETQAAPEESDEKAQLSDTPKPEQELSPAEFSAQMNRRKLEIERDLADKQRRQWTLIRVVYGCDFHTPTSRDTRRKDNPATSVDESVILPNELPYNPGMPEGIYCGELPPQWVLSIGGTIMRCHFDGTCPQMKQPVVDVAATTRQLTRERAKLARLKAAQAHAQTDAEENALIRADRRFRSRDAGNRPLTSGMQPEIDRLEELVSNLQADLDSMKGYASQSWNLEGAPIVGGIVVPIYFVVLALIGALVSMMRKLPEFQERVDPNYEVSIKLREEAGDAPPGKITMGYARDLLVFQMLQVLSAPAIAILAYSYAQPDQVATTVVLAFGAGFSSELILIGVRATVDRLVGMGPRLLRSRVALDMAAGQAKQEQLPPTGHLPPPAPDQLGGFKVGDRVTLVKPIDDMLPGAQGVVMEISAGNTLKVRTTEDHTGMSVEAMLSPKTPEFFRHATDMSSGTAGPAG
ncbi:MAG: hypothetical protein WDO72_13490 [Pseudomonadota bacterium]